MNASEIECQIACRRLVVASYSLMDHGKYDETVALFTEDGSWVRGGHLHKGQHAIAAALQHRPPNLLTRHIITNILVSQSSETEAHATALFIPLRGMAKDDGTAALTAPDMVGDLFYRFRREKNGWRILELEPRPRLKA